MATASVLMPSNLSTPVNCAYEEERRRTGAKSDEILKKPMVIDVDLENYTDRVKDHSRRFYIQKMLKHL